MLLGTCRFMFVLIILSLLIALSMRTTPKGTGAFFWNSRPVFHQGTGAVGEFQNHVFSNHPSSSSQRDGCLCGVSDSNLL